MTFTPTRPLDTSMLRLVTAASIVAILVVNYLVSDHTHAGAPFGARLVAIAVVTVFAAVAKVAAGPRAAAVTAVVGVLIAVVLLDQVA